MDMEHETKKDAPSAQQAAGSIDTLEFSSLLGELHAGYQYGPTSRYDAAHAALIEHITEWAGRPAATPAQPIAPPNFAAVIEALRFYAEGQHFVLHDADVFDTVSGEPQNWQEDESNTIMFEDGSVAKQALDAYSVAQPIADASAPTDERAAFETWMRTECGADDVSLQRGEDGHYLWGRTCDMWAACEFARAAAPVSGQGATLPPMTGQQVADALVENDPLTMVSIRRLLNGDPVTINLPELTRIVGSCIDSRPRSEDSRAEVEQIVRMATAHGENFVAVKKLREALASTTPQKADNE